MDPQAFYLLHVFSSKVSRFTATQMIPSSTSEHFTQNKPEVLSFNTAVLVVPSEPDQNPEHQPTVPGEQLKVAGKPESRFIFRFFGCSF